LYLININLRKPLWLIIKLLIPAAAVVGILLFSGGHGARILRVALIAIGSYSFTKFKN
jgi:hypothetical protein